MHPDDFLIGPHDRPGIGGGARGQIAILCGEFFPYGLLARQRGQVHLLRGGGGERGSVDHHKGHQGHKGQSNQAA